MTLHKKLTSKKNRQALEKKFEELLVSLGAVRMEPTSRDPWVHFIMQTPRGELKVHSDIDKENDRSKVVAVYSRFAEPQRAPKDPTGYHGLSPSGKWNHHYWATCEIDEIYDDLSRKFVTLMSGPEIREEGWQTNRQHHLPVVKG